MDLVGIKAYAAGMAELYQVGRPLTSWEKDWVQESCLAVSAREDLDSLEYEYKRRRLPHMIKSLFGGEHVAKLKEMLKAYMRGEDAAVKEKRDKPQGDGTLLTTFLLNLDQPQPTPEELAAAKRRKMRVSAQAKAIMEAMADPDSTRAHGVDRTKYTPPSER